MASSKNSPDKQSASDPVRYIQQTVSAQLSNASDIARPCFLIGFSGGLDSIVLLHAAAHVLGPAALTAVHVNHRLQPVADGWAIQCEATAKALGVNFLCEIAQRRPENFRDGLESWARDQRSAAFLRAAKSTGVNSLLLAHHQDDQAETVLWHLARGAGPDGIAGMRAVSRRDGLQFVRPLLSVPREILSAYAANLGLPVIEDPSNADTVHTRNRIRHQVMPELNQSFPGFDQSLLRAAANAADVSDALRIAIFNGDPPAELSRSELQARPDVLARQMLRIWLQARGVTMPDRRALLHWLPQLVNGDGAYAQIEHGDHLVCRYRDRIFLQATCTRSAESQSQSVQLHWEGQESIALRNYPGRLQFATVAPGELAVPARRLMHETLSVGPMRMSARIRPQPAGRSRQIKQLCQEHAISRWERRALPMLWLGDKPLFVAGLGMNTDCMKPMAATERGIRLQWLADT